MKLHDAGLKQFQAVEEPADLSVVRRVCGTETTSLYRRTASAEASGWMSLAG
ncbi:MAG: hypothetical protein ACRDOU_27525 [Streptosporangiaceae bacterium]